MTMTSYGYEGSVVEIGWARLHADAGGLYNIRDGNSWQVTVDNSGDRKLAIAIGEGSGKGVTDVLTTTPGSLTLTSVGSGSRWDMIVAHRDWTTNTTTFTIITGSALKQLPTRQFGFGTVDDQPIALCRVEAGKTAVQEIVDLRCWKSGGGMIAMDELALGYLTTPGATVTIKGKTWQYQLSSSYVASWVQIGGPVGPRVWQGGRGVTDSWTGEGGMCVVGITNPPPGDYFIAATASIRNLSGNTAAGSKRIRVNGVEIGQAQQDDIPGNALGWVTKDLQAGYHHPGGDITAAYFISNNLGAQVQSGIITVAYLGPVS